ncbi:DUF427 domain-containing protein [Aspergillus udagawae]|uniref:DUF427 domain-containing protein n=1 Tax=Aspergillus udagawae TaxID=91492 RepID=A0A8E0QU49_9EURO|nr:uncharacterized protein Aud_006771 [Aspergillus udagawae]GIC90337.1 hypothetical protein Aud_006771 [Aspergillus udagawae]
MPRALAKVGDHIVAETETWETVEGNIYVYRPCLSSTVVGFALVHAHDAQFPPSAIKDQSLLQHSDLSTFCSWKGYASYWNVAVDGKTIENAAWYYKEPYDAAKNIKDYIAFYKDKVEIVEE